MKAKNILMSILLAVGSIAAKAANGYPSELALVSQPVMVYNYNSITVYYDVENIGDYTYRGNVYLYLDPDYGYYYADKYVKVYPGRIKRIAIDIPMHRIDRGIPFTIMPYYEMGNELYSFTTFEYFEPISFYWRGPRTERWVVVSAPPRIRVYTRPGTYRYYYDGYRPPMPPPPPGGHGHGPGVPPPMNPMHHTYGYHSNNGGYPATHNVTPPATSEPAPSTPAPTATVRPKPNGGSMSSGGHHNSGNNPPAPTPAPNSGRTPSSGSNSSSGSLSRPSGTNTNSGVSRPSSGTSSSGRTGSSSVSRPSSSDNGPSTRPTTNGSSVSRPSSGSSSSSRPSATSSSGSSRVSGSSSTRSSGTSTGASSSSRSSSSNGASTRSSSNSSSSRTSGSSSGRR